VKAIRLNVPVRSLPVSKIGVRYGFSLCIDIARNKEPVRATGDAGAESS